MKMKRKAVIAMCGLGTSTIDRYMERGFFPKITPLTKVWESNDIKLWVKSHGKGPLGYTYGYANGTWPTWDEIVADARKQNDIKIKKVTEGLKKNVKKDQWLIDLHARAQSKAEEKLNQKREGAVNLRYVTERLRDIKNMDEVEAFYKECVYNIGINTLRNGEADG